MSSLNNIACYQLFSELSIREFFLNYSFSWKHSACVQASLKDPMV